MRQDLIRMALALLCAGMLLGSGLYHFIVIPPCAEDVVLIGTGDFVNGRWSSYECGPAWDDYK